MKNIKNILIILTLLLFSAGVANAQALGLNSDTVKTKTQKGDKQLQSRDQNQIRSQNQEMDRQKAQARNQKGNATGLKQVSGARPDWSKSRGARPASVERPSGSRIPKGVGRPGGARGPGKR
jgi:hypothetical protein